jgi:hypothetical protein
MNALGDVPEDLIDIYEDESEYRRFAENEEKVQFQAKITFVSDTSRENRSKPFVAENPSRKRNGSAFLSYLLTAGCTAACIAGFALLIHFTGQDDGFNVQSEMPGAVITELLPESTTETLTATTTTVLISEATSLPLETVQLTVSQAITVTAQKSTVPATTAATVPTTTVVPPASFYEPDAVKLIEKYMPDGAYDICQRKYDEHWGQIDITYYDADDKEIDVITYVQGLFDDLQAKMDDMTEEEYQKAQEELAQKTVAICQSADHRAYVYNDYRSGWDHQQWFNNCKYENGFWYVLRGNGTASIVGAEQEYFKGKEVLTIPSEIGGAMVKEIERGAFAAASIYFQDITEIVIPNTVETIGEAAFSSALQYNESGKINLPDGVKVIGRCAFMKCVQYLADESNVIHVPESIEYLGFSALGFWEDFYNSKVDSSRNYHLDMPDSLVLMEEYCFSNPENEKLVFLNGEANYLFMDDVAAFYANSEQHT